MRGEPAFICGSGRDGPPHPPPFTVVFYVATGFALADVPHTPLLPAHFRNIDFLLVFS